MLHPIWPWASLWICERVELNHRMAEPLSREPRVQSCVHGSPFYETDTDENSWSWNGCGCLKPCSQELCLPHTMPPSTLQATKHLKPLNEWNDCPFLSGLFLGRVFLSVLCHPGSSSKSFLLFVLQSLLLHSFYFEKLKSYEKNRETIKQMLTFIPPNISNILSYLFLIFKKIKLCIYI